MKFQSNSTRNLLNSVSGNEIKKLTKEIKETIAAGFGNKRKRIFTSAELWRIQNRKKDIFSRRTFF